MRNRKANTSCGGFTAHRARYSLLGEANGEHMHADVDSKFRHRPLLVTSPGHVFQGTTFIAEIENIRLNDKDDECVLSMAGRTTSD